MKFLLPFSDEVRSCSWAYIKCLWARLLSSEAIFVVIRILITLTYVLPSIFILLISSKFRSLQSLFSKTFVQYIGFKTSVSSSRCISLILALTKYTEIDPTFVFWSASCRKFTVVLYARGFIVCCFQVPSPKLSFRLSTFLFDEETYNLEEWRSSSWLESRCVFVLLRWWSSFDDGS